MTAPSGEQALLEAARGDDRGTPLFGSRPRGRPRLAEIRRFDGSDNVPPRYEVTGR